MLRPSPNHGTQRLPNDDDDVCISVYTDNKEANVNDPRHVVHYNRNMIHINFYIEHNITKMCNEVAVIYESDNGIVVGR